jgi:DNA polymerase-3 subunit chi
MRKTKVEFINLRRAGAELNLACARLAAFHYNNQRRVLVVAADQAQAQELDRLLWTFDPASFIPHAQAGGPDQDQEPVLIALGLENLNQAQVLILAAPLKEPPLAGFAWVIFFVPAREGPELTQSRETYRRLKQDSHLDLLHTVRLP